MLGEESRSLWPVKKDLEADAIPEIKRLFRRFETTYGFSSEEVWHQLETKEFLKKVFLVHKRFQPLIEEFEPTVKRINRFHKNHSISFSETDMPNILRMEIHAECMELPLLIRILKLILRKFNLKKRILFRESMGMSEVDFKKWLKNEREIKANKKTIRRTLVEMVIQQRKDDDKKITVHVRHKSGVFFAILCMKNFTITIKRRGVKHLVQEIKRTMPLLIKIMRRATKKVRRKKK